jgi:hypothetical protein
MEPGSQKKTKSMTHTYFCLPCRKCFHPPYAKCGKQPVSSNGVLLRLQNVWMRDARRWSDVTCFLIGPCHFFCVVSRWL